MKLSKNIKYIANEIVFHYATFDKLVTGYTLNIDKVPNLELHELISEILLANPSIAMEATGSDNPVYDSLIFPSMTRYFSDIYNREYEADYLRALKAGIYSYLKNDIEKLLNEALEEFNHCRNESEDEYVWAA